MSALSFICDYSSDSETENNFGNTKRVKLPAPDLSKVTVVACEIHEDDPAQHAGRTRSFPHVRGNWASYVYVKYPHENHLSNLIGKLETVVQSQNETWQRCSDVHISISKTFTLSYHLITAFTTNLQKAVNSFESFELEFNGVNVYSNEENTRTFIALVVDHFCQRHLLTLTQKVDEILSDYKLPKFYENPSFHMSIFWANGNKVSEITNILDELNKIVLSDCENHNSGIVDKVCCKSGNKYFQYSLL